MSVGASQSERTDGQAALALAPVRARGGFAVAVGATDGRTRLVDLEESGGWRLRFPGSDARHVEAVSINTGGGILGGDRFACRIDVPSGDLVVASQAAERIYRSLAPPAEVDIAVTVGAGARLDWLPQETILYSGARLQRRIDVALAANASLLMAESLVFGRTASGEVMGSGLLDDRWRIRRNGRLIFAEALRIDGPVGALLARPAVGGGAGAAALLVHVALDAEERRDGLRAALAGAGCHAGCDCSTSAWNGMLVARFLGSDASAVRLGLVAAIANLTRRALPRVWST
jgi:urease accessory protein